MQTVYLTLALVGFCVPAPFGRLYTLENPDHLFFTFPLYLYARARRASRVGGAI